MPKFLFPVQSSLIELPSSLCRRLLHITTGCLQALKLQMSKAELLIVSPSWPTSFHLPLLSSSILPGTQTRNLRVVLGLSLSYSLHLIYQQILATLLSKSIQNRLVYTPSVATSISCLDYYSTYLTGLVASVLYSPYNIPEDILKEMLSTFPHYV